MLLNTSYWITQCVLLVSLSVLTFNQFSKFFGEQSHISDTRTWKGWFMILTLLVGLEWVMYILRLFLELKYYGAYNYITSEFWTKSAHSTSTQIFASRIAEIEGATGIAVAILHTIQLGFEAFISHDGGTPTRVIFLLLALHIVSGWGHTNLFFMYDYKTVYNVMKREWEHTLEANPQGMGYVPVVPRRKVKVVPLLTDFNDIANEQMSKLFKP
jgi:hypothetical protein